MDNLKDTANQDSLGQYVRLKRHKLSSAVYLVSGALSDKEPLKWGLRSELLDWLKLDIGQSTFSILVIKIDYLLSLMDIALFCAGASKMNLLILKNEFLSLRNVLAEETARLQILPESPPLRVNLSPKTVNNHQINSSGKASNQARRAVILDLIRQKGALSIKDIANSIKNVSSKTVQRELADLVRNGIIKKEGEKRWSRYLLPA